MGQTPRQWVPHSAVSVVLIALSLGVAFPSERGSSKPPTLPPAFQAPRVVQRLSADLADPAAIRVLTWNIDRGSEFSTVAAELQGLAPSIAALQEVDSGARRSGTRDIAFALASALGFSAAFGVVFEELSQEQEGRPAYIGQATLTSLPLRTARLLRFQTQSGFWKAQAWLPSSLPLLQRRVGNRMALVTELDWHGRVLVVYNVHLESRSFARIQRAQLEEVLADCQGHYPASTAVLLLGDLNSKYSPSQYRERLEEAGFVSATGRRIERTHTIAMALDWAFARGLPPWREGHVDYSVRGSDHYPVIGTIARGMEAGVHTEAGSRQTHKVEDRHH